MSVLSSARNQRLGRAVAGMRTVNLDTESKSTLRLAPLGILQSYATPEQIAAEIRAEFKRVGEMARKTDLFR